MRKQAKPKISKTKPEPVTAVPGLRERKRQHIRERLTRMAMALFLERGFEGTTLDDIAAAADVSRRSFFHYFASKEDVVFAWQEEITAALIAAVAARPAAESMLTGAENAILAMIRRLEPGEAIAMAQFERDNPALQARDQVKYEKLERALADALARRAGHKTEMLKARLAAMIATGAMLWTTEGARGKAEAQAKRTFVTIRAILD